MKVQGAISRFESARTNLEAFRKQNPRFVEEYDMLREAYNSTLAEARAVYKDHHEVVGKKLGDFSASQRTDIDAEKLLHLMGDKTDPLVKISYKIDRDAYKKALEKGLIPGEVVDQVESPGSVTVRGPKAL